MASKIIGVEIGNDTLKLALCSGGVMKSAVVARMPENMVREGRPVSPSAMSEFIKKTMKDNGIQSGTCALVLPPQVMISHKVTMPVMAESELLLNLPFEFRDFVGKDGAKYDYDYSVISVKDNVMQLYAAAVRKDVVEEYYSILKKAGLTLKAAMPPEMAWLNLIRRTENAPKKLCIVDIGYRATQVNIFSDGSFEMGKEIEIGGAALDQAIAETKRIDPFVARTQKEANMENILSSDACTDLYAALAVEVMKIVNFYRFSTEDGSQLQDIYCCGGGALIETLRTGIMKATELTMHQTRRLVSNEIQSDELVMCAALAAGAAMQLQ